MVAVAPGIGARVELEERYEPHFTQALDWGKFVNYGLNRSEPVFRWYRYKEAFSRRLVEDVLQEDWALPAASLVFDPFAGCGTTLLASQESGYDAVGCDIMPIAVFVTRVKLAHGERSVEQLSASVRRLLQGDPPPSNHRWPPINIVNVAFGDTTRRQLLAYRDAILRRRDPLVRDFLMLGLLASLEEVSHTSKDGQFLRIVDRPPRSVRQALEKNYARMLSDLRALELTAGGSRQRRAHIFPGDARSLPHELRGRSGEAKGIITSPPYLNRYDYSRTYALELCLMYDEEGCPLIEEFEDLRSIRHSLLRSHIESKPAPTDLVSVPALDEILAALASKQLNNGRIPIMIKGYFEGMNLAIREMARMLAPDGRVALVVANARFEGELVPVDLILSEIAAEHGLETDEIRVTRYKGNSSQQMGKYGKVPVRETVCFWRKH